MANHDKEILQIIREGLAAKAPQWKIAEDLNKKGYLTTTGKKWMQASVSEFSRKNGMRLRTEYVKKTAKSHPSKRFDKDAALNDVMTSQLHIKTKCFLLNLMMNE